ncbi:MAG: hypothetical protein JRH13_02080 [Deltaproteobacteria bacterium]|nr:hypothetical protein [Deltaproteobacteria bacterium]MBW2016878.1 hypothetical protein [Deltaproteobacteria bacterium]MBW2128134.1 hypothetical protein [Deltaproteobacteria bacterium]MBW2304581.1 hypothetical protein [Deltaproteobacteria bacterium]
MILKRKGIEAMEIFHDYVQCDDCGNKNFRPVYSFSIRFYGVNFSDELIYDKLTDESYQCTECGKIYTIGQIEEKLAEFKKIRKRRS